MQVAAAVIAIHPAERRMPAPRKHAASCSSCNLRELCLPGALDAEDLARIDNLVYARRRLKRGEALYQAGAEFKAIYAIRSGSFKASLFDGDGREQVSGFFMAGELLGLEGLGSGAYQAGAIALEDSEVCV
ncbi:MAG: cyclic nucleotide-binding domain-containing protein, partial [Burkholderiales bacterium]